METNKKLVRKSFLPHQYEKEEEFLTSMGKEGWHFVAIKQSFASSIYEFIEIKPKNYCYQLDYVTKEENTDDYHQLFQDAGWEEVAKYNGLFDGVWYYFRKENKESKNNKIFTDSESRYRMYRKLLKHWGGWGIFLIIISINFLLKITNSAIVYEGWFGVLNIVLDIFCSMAMVFYVYMVIMIFKEMKKWEKPKC